MPKKAEEKPIIVNATPETDDLKEQKKKEEDKEKGFRVVDKRKLSTSEKKNARISAKKKDEKGWETVSGISGGKMPEEKEPTLSEINQLEIDRLEWEKSSDQSRAAMPKEKIEEFDDSFIKKLENEVEAKRNKYAMADYKATNVISRIKKVLSFMKTNPSDVSEVQGLHTDYMISQNMLLDEKIKALKAKGLSGEALKKEMGDSVNYFKVEEKRKLFEAHTNSRAKYVEEKFGNKPGKIMEFSSRYINWHRKQAGWKKTIVGLRLGSIGLGFVGRTVGAVTAGAGTKELLEGIYRKRETKKENKEKEKVLANVESAMDKFEKPAPPETLPVSYEIPEAGKSLEIKSGSSLSQTLEENGLGKKKINSMLEDYVKREGIESKDLDTVYPEQKIILSPDGKSIEKILESPDSHLMKSITEISGENNSVWREIKDLTFDQIEKPSLAKGLAKAMEKYHEILGDSANPNDGEKIQNWVARMAKLAMEKQK